MLIVLVNSYVNEVIILGKYIVIYEVDGKIEIVIIMVKEN